MALDFKWLTHETELIEVSLNDQALKMLEPAFKELEKKTGVFVEPYENTRISPDHAQLLHQTILKGSPSAINEVKDFVEMLAIAVDKSWWILAVGD